jgi:CubicO group peptidase (beta-lactamase class C family)
VGASLSSLAWLDLDRPARRRSSDAYLDVLIGSLEKGMGQWLQDTKMPSASIAIIRGGHLAWRKAFGVKDAGTKEPADTDSVYAACSNTKPVFAYAVAKLCERGVMGLDTPLATYTPDRFAEDPRVELITARHVLNHTTGFPNWRQEPQPLTMEFTPGERYQYSGEGFSYLQSVVVRRTGQAFEEFMRDNLLRPFGMTSSRFSWDVSYARRIAKPHDASGARIAGKYEKLPSVGDNTRNLARYGAAASLLTTPTDYARFILEILNPKPTDRFRLNPTNRRELLRPQVRKNESQWTSLGWAIVQAPGSPTLFVHAGQDAGYYCVCTASEQSKSAIIVMTNGDNYDALLAKAFPDPAGFIKGFFGG